MATLFQDYIKLVKSAYLQKRDNNELSLQIAQPTPAGLKKECEIVCKERFDKKDIRMLRMVFGPGNTEQEFLQSIRNFQIDKLKPLVNYLKGDTEKTDDKNVELLAWLINFPHRPFSFGNTVIPEKKSAIGNHEQPTELTNERESDKFSVNAGNDRNTTVKSSAENFHEVVNLNSRFSEPTSTDGGKTRYIFSFRSMIITFVALITCAMAFWAITNSGTNRGCMYWAEDHFEEISCDDKSNNVLKLPKDNERIITFRKIVKTDTITQWSIGKIYYLKTNNQIEYFTSGGRHPVHLNRDLKKLSTYIYETYLHQRDSTSKFHQ